MNYKAMIKRQSTVIAIAVICLTIATIGVSYALFFQVETNTNNQVVTAGTLNVSYGSGSSSITATELVPMDDDEALSTSTMTGTIYVENTGTLPAIYEVALGNDNASFNARSDKTDSDELLSHDYLKVAAYLNGTMVVEPTALSSLTASVNSTDSYKLFEGSLDTTGTGNSTMTIVIKVWIDEDAPESIIGDFVYLKMDITSAVAEGNLKSTVIAHATENNYLYTTTPDFSKATTDGEYGLYTAADDDGISYYYRGDVENNYVKFGTYAAGSTVNGVTYEEETPMYWRIVRINGDGSIRMIYDGTSAVANGTSHTATIAYTAYNTDYDNEKYVGYTYDTSEADSTQVNSTIKGVVDAWYDAYLEANYGSYIADSIFCNDRKVSSYTYYDENYSQTTADKAVYTDTNYAPSSRLGQNKAPKLTCTRKEDRYTTSEATGNGLLTNPIGLLTADEAFFAGGTTTGNNSYYLYSNEAFWNSAPYGFDVHYDSATAWYVYGDGYVGYFVVNYDDSGARPVINLKADVEFVGDGTINTPYQIKELAE